MEHALWIVLAKKGQKRNGRYRIWNYNILSRPFYSSFYAGKWRARKRTWIVKCAGHSWMHLDFRLEDGELSPCQNLKNWWGLWNIHPLQFTPLSMFKSYLGDFFFLKYTVALVIFLATFHSILMRTMDHGPWFGWSRFTYWHSSLQTAWVPTKNCPNNWTNTQSKLSKSWVTVHTKARGPHSRWTIVINPRVIACPPNSQTHYLW